MCQHLERAITLYAWLVTCTSVWLQKCRASRTRWASRTDAWVHISTLGWNGACGAVMFRLLHWDLRYELVSYRLNSKLWWIVINVSDSDDSSGCVGEAVHGVALHVSGLNDQRVLRHFLEKKKREITMTVKWKPFQIKVCITSSTRQMDSIAVNFTTIPRKMVAHCLSVL